MASNRFAQTHDRIRPAHIVLAAAIVALGALLRGVGAMGEMWLDELWSLDTALALNAWHEAFWTNFSDNSHPLNTAWMHLMGAARAPWVYRIEAVVLSTLAIAVAGWTMARHGAGNAPGRVLTAMLLLAVMYPFVHYGSEARGYGAMGLFVYLAFAAVEDATDGDPSARWRFGLWGALGLVSHLASLPVMVFLAFGHMLRLLLDGRTLLQALNATARLSGPYLAVLLAFAVTFLFDLKAHDFVIPFGNSTLSCPGAGCFVEALGELVRFSAGGFSTGQAELYVGLAAIFTIGAVAWLGAVGNRRAVYYAALLLALPLLFLAVDQPTLPHGRYFLGMFAFWPLLFADVFGEVIARGRVARLLAAIALLALICVNAWAVSRFHQTGRGDTTAAFNRMNEDLGEGLGDAPLSVGTNMVFQFHLGLDNIVQRHAPGLDVIIVPRKEIARAAPDWLVTVSVPPEHMPPAYCEGDVSYALISVHSYWGFSGSHWGLYKKTTAKAKGVDCPSVPQPRTRFK